MSQTTPTPDTLVRVAQIITLAMVAGVVLFGLVAVVGLGALSDPRAGNILSLIGAAFTFVQVGLVAFVPDLMARRATATSANTPAEVRPYGAYMTRHIIRLALLEGAAFLNIIATIQEHNWWSLGIAGLLVGWMLTNIPTRDRVETWVALQEAPNGQ